LTELPEGCEGWDCRYYGTARLNGEDKDCCLATGEVVLVSDLEHCPLQAEEEQQKEITNEEIKRYGELLSECEASLRKINLAVSKLTASFDREDLEALIYGKTKLPKKVIRAVLDAIEKAKKTGDKHALKKFIATIGDVRIRDVSAVLDEIERLNEKYAREESA